MKTCNSSDLPYLDRIVDIALENGEIYAEERGYCYDYTKDEGYLFSVAVPVKLGKCELFREKSFKKATIPTTGKLWITIPYNKQEYLCVDTNYDVHIDGNLKQASWGTYVDPAYGCTLILDLAKREAHTINEECHMDMIIKEEEQNNKEWQQHYESMKNYPRYI